jgi:hypothetical protein
MSSIDSLIKQTLSNTSNTTIDAAVNIVVSLKPKYMDRKDDAMAAADDVLNEVISLLYIFKTKMNEAE